MIRITYRHTSRLSMRIGKNGDVLVSAPLELPRSEVDAFIEKNRGWIVQAQEKTYKQLQTRNNFFLQLPLRTEQQKMDAIRRAQELIEPMVERHAQIMGLEKPFFYFKATISRWGQCNIKDRSIYFSIFVLLLPEWCVEHVVVHELCHLLEPSHNARFHDLMDNYFPRWREARAETRRIWKMEEES